MKIFKDIIKNKQQKLTRTARLCRYRLSVDHRILVAPRVPTAYTFNSQQGAQLSQRDRATHSVSRHRVKCCTAVRKITYKRLAAGNDLVALSLGRLLLAWHFTDHPLETSDGQTDGRTDRRTWTRKSVKI